jgi:hypothetical protein
MPPLPRPHHRKEENGPWVPSWIWRHSPQFSDVTTTMAMKMLATATMVMTTTTTMKMVTTMVNSSQSRTAGCDFLGAHLVPAFPVTFFCSASQFL